MIFQDNTTSLSLEKNRRVSSSKQTRYVKGNYFLIKGYYKSGEIGLCYCPTDVMWADILTKHSFLQNCPSDYENKIKLQTDKLAHKIDELACQDCCFIAVVC